MTSILSNPTPTSHWVIPARLIAGDMPSYNRFIFNQSSCAEKVNTIIDSGVNVVVRLQEEAELFYFHDYSEIFKKVLDEKQKEFKLLKFPIKDYSIADNEEELLNFIVLQVIPLIEAGNTVYIHCFGGHGRTGIVVSCILGILYSLDAEHALELNNKLHSARASGGTTHKSPETDSQRQQVHRVLELAKSKGHLKKFEIQHCGASKL